MRNSKKRELSTWLPSLGLGLASTVEVKTRQPGLNGTARKGTTGIAALHQSNLLRRLLLV